MRLTPSAVLRFAVPAALLLAAALFLHARSRPEPQAAHLPIRDFPRELGGWSSKDIEIAPEVREILGPGDFLSRIYMRPDQPYVDLFVAYFPTQRTGNSIHSPKNCLPGSGWAPTESSQLQITGPGGAPVTVNRYIISKGLDRELVLYWYQAHARVVASEYWAKYFLVADSIRMNRSDGSLVRVITPIAPHDSPESAQQRAVEFAQSALGQLDSFIPR
ncbi:MAG: EpsI family protein [Acidobacteriia bacterium]|nr:EpsI family protein [Terriglobia bacterium]